jgi:hypothetical protein
MSEYETKPNASVDPQLQMLVADLESKFLAADDALSELRHAVRQLKAYQPPAGAAYQAPPMPSQPIAPAEPAYTPPTFQEPVSPPVDAWPAQTEPDAQSPEKTETPAAPSVPRLEEETVGKSFWPGPAKASAPEPEQKPRFEDYGMDSTSEGSWPIARRSDPMPQPEPEAQPTAEVEFQAAEEEKQEISSWEPEAAEAPAADEDDQARRDEVARFVAEMQDSSDEEDTASEPVEVDDEKKRRSVADMVAQLRDSVEVEPEEPTGNGEIPSGDDEDARRQDVARMVAEIRSGHFDAGDDDKPAESESGAEDDSTREDVANMVAQMRAEMGGAGGPERSEPAGTEDESSADDSDADVRDEVRRAVEAARAEMASGYTASDETKGEGGEGDKRFNFTEWQSTHVEPSGPPVIVIKDSEGRVELARVYETLSRVNCDENAALLNYTPHSVTVGLNAKASVPDVDAMTEAVRAIFGRACEVDSDGVRVNVQIGRDLKGKDSAA